MRRTLSLTLAALAIAGASATLAGYVTFRPAPTPATPTAIASPTYALDRLDIAGDGGRETIHTGLSVESCDHLSLTIPDDGYLYVCRPFFG